MRPSAQFAKNHFRGRRMIAAEVSVYLGDNAWVMLGNMPLECLYLIDPYDTNSGYDAIQESNNIPPHDAFLAAKKLIGNPPEVRWVIKKSLDAAKDIGIEFDYVYIDGDHRYESVSQDIRAWYKKIRRGGILAGHDYKTTYKPEIHEGIGRAVDEFFGSMSMPIYSWDIDWWVIKP